MTHPTPPGADALGEGVVGTVAALSAIVEQQGWTVDTAFVGVAGLHVAAYFIEGVATISPLAIVLAVAIPVGVYLGLVYALYYYLLRRFDPFHIWLLLGTIAVVAAAVAAAASGTSMARCLLILTLAPVVTVIGYETRAYRHQAESLMH